MIVSLLSVLFLAITLIAGWILLYSNRCLWKFIAMLSLIASFAIGFGLAPWLEQLGVVAVLIGLNSIRCKACLCCPE